ncbi:MAG: SEC-C metal-binding domain-containing protein [Bacillota bacterium]|nr:SEC-C metal-binding domain-containing protein [Bacillota bacterium]
MSLFEQWRELLENQTEETFRDFWTAYSTAETDIYTEILSKPRRHLKGVVSELAEKFNTTEVIFTGFLDGINSSLKAPLDVEATTSETEIDLKVNFEELYFNMLEAGADYLYNIPQWEKVLTEEKREEIKKKWKKSKTVVKEKTPGRNDPCPCGSGKKYKKCCGANQ